MNVDIEGNWKEFRYRVDVHFGGRFTQDGSNGVLRVVDYLAPDTKENGKVYFGLKRGPGAKGNHHAYPGGMVQHLLEMYYVWDSWKGSLLDRATPEARMQLENWRVFAGIIFHDLHKAHFHHVELEGGGIEYSDHPVKKLLTDDQRTLWLLSQHGVKLDLLQANALFHSEGGFARSPPMWDTVLSKLLYLLDEYSGNVMGRVCEHLPVMGDRGRPTYVDWKNCGLVLPQRENSDV